LNNTCEKQVVKSLEYWRFGDGAKDLIDPETVYRKRIAWFVSHNWIPVSCADGGWLPISLEDRADAQTP